MRCERRSARGAFFAQGQAAPLAQNQKRRCEARSDEAIQSAFATLDCFVSLAMTIQHQRACSKYRDRIETKTGVA
jgi:hypothetical protein